MKFIFRIVAMSALLFPLFSRAQEDVLFPHHQHEKIWLSGQANVVFQTQPGVRTSEPSLLSSRYEKATTRVLSLYTGFQLSDSVEFLFDLEHAGGQGLSRGLGLAAPPNAEFTGEDALRPIVSRLMMHKVIALSKTKVENDATPLSTFRMLPSRRIELRAGKFSAPDFFDTNVAGGDTHLNFLNSALIQNAAYDYASNASGYTWGLMAEYAEPRWALRFAELMMPLSVGSSSLSGNLKQFHSENVELQIGAALLPHRRTTLRALGFVNHGRMLRYSEPLVANASPVKLGVGLNVEQQITRSLTAFARVGWNDGQTESFCYVEVDQTVATGLVLRGDGWHRPFDRVGFGVASNGITARHEEFLASGHTGLMLSHPLAHYGREAALEGFYTWRVRPGLYLSPSVQWIENPGFDQAQGRMLVAGLRTHVEF